MGLNVIGTGFGRTGTDSMRRALNTLGAGPTHHMREVVRDAKTKELWLDLVKGAAPDWEVLFAGYHACVDWPSAFYWRSLIDIYPDAKVLLTMRAADMWWNSFESTILKYIKTSDDPNSFAIGLVAEQVFGGCPDDREHAISVYNRHVEDVITTVAPERLLVHNIGDGWEPLSEWLGVPVPDIDYPRENTTREFVQRLTG